MKIIVTTDFLCHSKKYVEQHTLWLFQAFLPIIKSVLTTERIYTDVVDENNNIFSRAEFFKLGGHFTVKDNYQVYKVQEFNLEQLNYLARFFDENTVVLGLELYKPMTDLLSSFGVKVIDMAFHSYKLFDDLAFAINTNSKEVYETLLKYQIPQDKFHYYANYWKVFMKYNNMVYDSKIEDNSCIFIGQTLQDKSVEKDGVFLNVTHFEEKLKELSEQYSKVYYLPHPYLGRKRKVIYDFIKKCPYVELLENCSTYGLLASDKVKKVVAISTSVLYESQYFGKEIEYLYKPLFNIDAPFEEHSYVSIYEDYWNPKFWADILSPVCEIRKDVKDVNYFKGCSNKLRNIKNNYWGYAQLDPIKRIPTFKESIKDLYRQYIAPLF